jgi:hypothetical protein
LHTANVANEPNKKKIMMRTNRVDERIQRGVQKAEPSSKEHDQEVDTLLAPGEKAKRIGQVQGEEGHPAAEENS